MAVFPERMNPVDKREPEVGMGTMEDYINYMVEHIEAAISNMSRRVTEAGDITNYSILLMMEGMDEKLTAMRSSVDDLRERVNSKADSSDLNKISTKLSEVENDISDIETSVLNLEQRVYALEGGE